jgi:hypothetical protein
MRAAALSSSVAVLAVLVGCCGSSGSAAPPLGVKPADLERAIEGIPSIRSVRCVNGAASGLGNPWRCTARRGGSALRFVVGVDERGGYSSRSVESTPPARPRIPADQLRTKDGKIAYVGAFNSGEALLGAGVRVAPG